MHENIQALLDRHAAELKTLREQVDQLFDQGERDHTEMRTRFKAKCAESDALRQRAEAAERDRNILARAIDPRSETKASERSTESLLAWAEGIHEQVKAAEAALEAIKAEVAGDANFGLDAAMGADEPATCLTCPHPKHEGRCKGEAPNAQFSCACQGSPK